MVSIVSIFLVSNSALFDESMADEGASIFLGKAVRYPRGEVCFFSAVRFQCFLKPGENLGSAIPITHSFHPWESWHVRWGDNLLLAVKNITPRAVGEIRNNCLYGCRHCVGIF